jgi:hypothetical protein
MLARAGDNKEGTWWLYWGTIPPAMLNEATDLARNCHLEGWPANWLLTNAP